MSILRFEALPLPYFINSGFSLAGPGRKHPERWAVGEFDLIVVKQGCLYIGEEERRYEVSEGHALVLRPDLHHYPTEGCRETTASYWLHFQAGGAWRAGDPEEEEENGTMEEERLESGGGEKEDEAAAGWFRKPTFGIELPQFARLLHPAKMYEALQRLIDLDRNSHMDSVRWEQQALFQQALMLLAESMRAERSRPGEEIADRAASYLRSRYREPISSKDLAEALNFHPVYIARRMRKQFGCSPMEYLIRCRLEQAKRLLLQTDLSVAQIALETGFRQAAYFTACFGKRERMTPREFRLRFLKG